MKLVRLTLRHWGPFAHAEFAPGAPIVLVYGQNASGKTTLADALQWLVSGHARGVPDRGPGQLSLIRTGAAEGVVEGEWQTSQGEQVTLRRKLGRTGSAMVGTLPGDKVAREAAAMFFHGEDVLDLEPEAQKAMLLAATEPKISLAALRQAVSLDAVPAEVLPRPAAADPDGAATFLNRADVAAIYQWGYDARTDSNRRLNALGSVEPIEWPGGVALAPKDMAALEATLTALRTEEQAMAVEVGETIGRRKALAERVRSAMHRSEQAQQAITTLLGSRASGEALRQERDALQGRIERAQAAQVAWQKDLEEVRRVNQAVRDRRADRAGAVKQFAVLGASCVIHASIPCPLQGEAKTQAALRLTRQLEEAETERIEPEPHPPEVRDVVALERARDELTRALASLATKTEVRKLAEAEVQELLAQGAKPSEVLNEPEVPAALTTLRQRIAAGTEKVKLAGDLSRREAARAEAIAQGATLRTTVAWLTDVVKALGPKGVVEAQMTGSLDELMALANTWLEPWHLALSWKTEPFALMTPDGRLASRLSKSERWRVSAALSLACAVRAGWKTVVLDGADVLLPEIRGPLGPMLGAAAAAGLRVIVTVAGSPPVETSPFPTTPRPAKDLERWQVVESPEGATLHEAAQGRMSTKG